MSAGDAPTFIDMVTAVETGVREAVLNGRYEPGQRLTAAKLMAHHNVSRDAVRTALLRLEAEGIVEHEPNRSPRVRSISLDEAVEIAEARSALEGLCAARAAVRATCSDRARLRELGTELGRAPDERDALADLKPNQLVYQAIRDISGNRTAGHALARLRTWSAHEHLLSELHARRTRLDQEELGRVIEMVCTGDADGADRAMRAHLRSFAASLRQVDATAGCRSDVRPSA